MTVNAGVSGVERDSWRVSVLPLPKRHSRGAAYGFCGGHPAGRAETARGRSVGCWWPNGAPELLSLDNHPDVGAGRAGGDLIPGHWSRRSSGVMGAVVWARTGHALAGADRADRRYESTWATAAGGGVAVGVGSPPGNLGSRGNKVGLVWRGDDAPQVLTGKGDVALLATDGTRLAGSLDGRATLWPSADADPIDLAPTDMPPSEVQALDGDCQIGIAWKGLCARAALWRGSAASFCDLTPPGFESGRAFGGSHGLQVGFIRTRDTTRNGSTACDNIAVLWQGAPGRWFDLNALLPAKTYNASVAWSIEIRDGELRICGEANRYEVGDPGTEHECHAVPVAHAVIWTARWQG